MTSENTLSDDQRKLTAASFMPWATTENVLSVATDAERSAANLRGLARELGREHLGDLCDSRIEAADQRVKVLEVGEGATALLIDDVEVYRSRDEQEVRSLARGARMGLVAIAQAAVRADLPMQTAS